LEEITQKGIEDGIGAEGYYPRQIGTCAVAVTADGFAHVFRRGMKTPMYPGHWHGIAGVVDIDESGEVYRDVSLVGRQVARTIRKEFTEEAGRDDARVVLTGIATNGPITVDYTHSARLSCDSQTFLDSVSEALHASDHTDVRVLKDEKAIRDFLESGEAFVPCYRTALELELKHRQEIDN
jgi:hypothetical protein